MTQRSWIYPILTLFALAAVACGGGDSGMTKDGKRKLTFLTMQLQPTFNEYFENLFAEFEAENPDVKIEWLDYPYQNYETKLMTSYLGEKAPDVVNLPSESLPDYIDRGYIVPLNDLVAKDTLDSFVPAILSDGCIYEDQAWAFPWYASSKVSFFNKSLFEEAGLEILAPPRYWEEVPGIAEAIQKNAGGFAVFPMYTEQGSLRNLLWEAGVPLLNEDETKAAFNTPKGLEVLTFWTDLYKKKLVPSEALAASHRRPIELFKTGNLAIMATGPQFIRQVKADAPDVYEHTMVGPYLVWRNTERYMISLHTIAVTNQANDKELAAKFAEFVTNATNQLEFCKLTTIIPSVTDALNNPYFMNPESGLEGEARRYSAEQTIDGKVFRPLPKARDLYEVFDNMIEQVALGKMTPKEGLNMAEEKWNDILAE